MDTMELKSTLYGVVARFFSGATVVWSEQIIPQPMPPYVTLKTGRINRTTFTLAADGDDRYYQAELILEINLYTDGTAVFKEGAAVTNKANTAVGDLTDFLVFLESEATQDYLSDKGIAMEVLTPPNDVSQLINDVHFRYRAMTELTVYFPIKANGAYGMSDSRNTRKSVRSPTAVLALLATAAPFVNTAVPSVYRFISKVMSAW